MVGDGSQSIGSYDVSWSFVSVAKAGRPNIGFVESGRDAAGRGVDLRDVSYLVGEGALDNVTG
jgi:hypothetical protein